MNFGIVGTGLIAEFHARALAEIPGARLVACLDKFPERSAQFAEKHGCKAYEDLTSFLSHPGLEDRQYLHAFRPSHGRRPSRGRGRQAPHHRKTPRDVDGALRENYRSLRARRRHAFRHFSLPLFRRGPIGEARRRRGQVRPAVDGQRLCQMVEGTELLLQGRLEGDEGPGRRRSPHQSVDSRGGSAVVVHGRGEGS